MLHLERKVDKADARVGDLLDAVVADLLPGRERDQLVAAHHVHLGLAVLGEAAEVLERQRRGHRLLGGFRGRGLFRLAEAARERIVLRQAGLAALQLAQVDAVVRKWSGSFLNDFERGSFAPRHHARHDRDRGGDDRRVLLPRAHAEIQIHDFTM